ncbi:alpha/beta hydrolase [Spongiimicrobium salis]|uniref:alpha/beta hydrolase n=1 Tax=Spongiimicrobium salis TaxID=1667022 RepID=UPI00374CD4CD
MKSTLSHRLLYSCSFILCLLPFWMHSQVISTSSEDLFTVGSASIYLQSEINQSDYTLHINLPASYGQDSTKTYPVFYALDGYRVFGTTTHVYEGLWDDGFSPEIIIVGITHGHAKTDPTAHRTRDLTPTRIERIPTSGEASLFLKVLEDEIIPMIDQQYRSDPTNRTLMGTSFAALFTHYVLFTQPTLFHRYIIHNPTLWWDNKYPYALEETYHKNHTELQAKVLLINSEHNDMTSALQMLHQIQKHHYKGLELGFRKVENMGHLGGEAEALNQGMRFVYKRPSMRLPEDQLKAYCGTYKNGNYIRNIVLQQGELTLMREGAKEGLKIQAVSTSEFAVLGRYFDFHFNRNGKGEVIGFSSQRDPDPSNVITALKVN